MLKEHYEWWNLRMLESFTDGFVIGEVQQRRDDYCCYDDEDDEDRMLESLTSRSEMDSFRYIITNLM